MMFSEFGFFIYLIFFRARVGGGEGGGVGGEAGGGEGGEVVS